MRFDSLAILILSAGCMTPFVIAGLLQMIDRIIERGMYMKGCEENDRDN